jgi:hypothetical protein
MALLGRSYGKYWSVSDLVSLFFSRMLRREAPQTVRDDASSLAGDAGGIVET